MKRKITNNQTQAQKTQQQAKAKQPKRTTAGGLTFGEMLFITVVGQVGAIVGAAATIYGTKTMANMILAQQNPALMMNNQMPVDNTTGVS